MEDVLNVFSVYVCGDNNQTNRNRIIHSQEGNRLDKEKQELPSTVLK
jgi:hypothetical protein